MTPKRIATSISLLVLLFTLLLNASQSMAAPLQAVEDFNILLGRPTDDSITVNVIPDQTGQISFEYGTTPGVYGNETSAVSCTADEPVEVVIEGLTSNTRYYYRLRFRAASGDQWTAGVEHSFHTQRPLGSIFTFTIISDSHMSGGGGNVSLYQQTLTNVATENPDFHFDLGDTFWTDGVTNSTTANQRFLAQRQWMGTISHSTSVFVAPGNHENEEGWNLDDANSVALLSINARKRYYPNPIPDTFYSGNPDTSLTRIDGDHLREDYFAWEWGDALFIVIDPFQYTLTKPYSGTAGGEVDDEGPASSDNWDWTLGQDQFNWFKQTLENSDATFKFVFAHHMVGGLPAYNYVRGGAEAANLYEWGGYDSDGTTWGFDTKRSEWGSIPIHQLMAANGVSAFFYGHDHEYAYQERDGVVYQLVPSPSMTGYGFGLYDEDDPYTIRVLPNSGHLRVMVTTTQATVDYVGTSSGTVNYSYTIDAEPSGPTHDLTMVVDPAGSGTTNPGVGVHTYPENEVVAVTATPSAGFVFDHWSGDCLGTATCQVTMNEDKSVTAHFAAAPVGTITYVGGIGSAVSKTSDTSLVVNTTAPVAAGDDIIIAYATDPNANIPPISVADAVGNTYSQVGYVVNTGQLRTYIFAAYNVNALPAGSNITITANAAVTARAAVVSVFRGLADEDVVDQTSTGENDSSTTASSGATATTTQADELLIGGIGTEGPDGDTAGTWQDSFIAGPRLGTTGGTDDTNITAALGWRIVTAVGSYTASKTGMTQRDHASVIATFKAGPGGTAPRIRISGTPLSAFTSLPGTPSAEQSYTVSGSNLTDDITITALSDFEISLTSGSGFASSLTLSQSGGSVAETPIYVRFNRATEGTSTGNITHTSTDATTRNVAVSGTAAPLAPVSFNILLGRPTDESVTANIIPDQDAEFYIEYGTSSGSYTAGQTDTFIATADVPSEIVIGGALSANQKYYYHIVYRQTGTTEWNEGAEYSFETQKVPGSTFTFDIVSDSHFDQYGGQTMDEKALYEQTLLNVGADHPDFYLDLGDTFAMDPLDPYGTGLGTGMTEANADAAYRVQRPYMGLIANSVPLFLAIGNHENEEGWNWDDTYTSGKKSLAIVGLKARKKYIPNPIPDDFYSANTDALPAEFVAEYPALSSAEPYHEDYYAWEWGDALFVVIDPYHYSMTWPNDDGGGYGGEGQDGEASGDRWDWTLGIEQYLWFRETLENSDATYKFVFSHHVTGGETPYGRGGIDAAPYFEWGGKNADGTWGWDTHRPASEGWDVPIHQLMVENGVNVYFHGHDHIYAREELDEIVYLEVPKPDDAGYDWQPYGYGYNEDLYLHAIEMIPNSGHIRVTVSPTEATLEYVRSYLPGDGTNGVVADSVTITVDSENNPPDQPVLVTPDDGATDVSTSPTLEVTISDPDGNNLDVTFYGREVGSGSFASLGMDSAVASGASASIIWSSLAPDAEYEWYVEVSDGSDTTTSPNWTFTTAEVTSEANLIGTVTLQRPEPAPHASWIIPLTVELYEVGEPTPAYSFTPTTDDSGEFTVSSITPGTYEIAAKNSHTLQVVDTVDLVAGSNSHDFGTLREGDANDDNQVDLSDFSLLSTAFNTFSGDAGYNVAADFNNDGSVDLSDFSLLSTGFNQFGEEPSGNYTKN